MHKVCLFLVAASVFAMSAGARAGDLLLVSKLKISGVIRQQPTSGLRPNTRPITIANILSVLNITGQDPDNLQYYIDETLRGYAIAQKGLADGSTATPVAVVLVYGLDEVNWDQAKASLGATSKATGLNGNLAGAQEDVYTVKFPSRTFRRRAMLSGIVNNLQTTMDINVTDVRHQ